MDSWLAWAGFMIAIVLLGWLGYHSTVLTLRLVTAAFALAVVVLVTRYGVTHPAEAPTNLVDAFTRGEGELSGVFLTRCCLAVIFPRPRGSGGSSLLPSWHLRTATWPTSPTPSASRSACTQPDQDQLDPRNHQPAGPTVLMAA
jgi:hypothetical protein